MASSPMPLQPASPPYAFNGAYANYSLVYSTQSGAYAYISDYTITNVDEKAQTFSVTSSYNSYFAPFGSVDNATFQAPIPFPAASPSQLQLFKEGKAPLVYGSDNITANVIITVPAGTFLTYQLEAPVSTVWFDSVTGLLVKERGLMLGEGDGGFVYLDLSSTNVRANVQAGDQSLFLLTLTAVGGVAACLFVSMSLHRRRVGNSSPSPQADSQAS